MIDNVLKLVGVKPPAVLVRQDRPDRRVAATGRLKQQIEGIPVDEGPFDVLAFDAGTVCRVADLRQLFDFFQPRLSQLARNGRIVVLAPEPGLCPSPEAAAAARAVEGFVRTLAKEVGGRGATANLLYLAPGADHVLAGPAEFFGSAASCYVSGQAIHLDSRVTPANGSLAGKLALVTGAARGIGAATAARLASQGANVVGLDVPVMSAELAASCQQIGARPLALDMAGEGAASALAAHFSDGIDIVVHNAGITRDRTLAKMQASEWDQVIGINLSAILRANEALNFRSGARIVCLSSTSGIAGNFGQANYAASKAALIGYVAAAAPGYAERGMTINAVAPGFIETPMTQRMPFLPREIGRRANSLKQAGRPEDVAALVTFLCSPGAFGITGNTIRVCGQSIMGA
jgi:3-oxoacyl-[acyl-carrier protein] reductase